MNKTRQIFETQQAQVLVCGSGRVMVAINEEKLKAAEQVPVAMTKNGVMKYKTREKTQYAYDVYWITLPSSSAHDAAAMLAAAKTEVEAAITAYDSSSAVNAFLLNGIQVWLDKATRVGLMNSTTIAKNMGQEKTTLWLSSYQLEVDCDKAIQLLSALEMYALECFNVTAAHKKAVSELDNIEAVLTYDYKSGYPEKLKMEV
jgi:hypothetical protein|nr:MAG TPA: protein of unknown function DUF4376 [Caudoviricetes sp.]